MFIDGVVLAGVVTVGLMLMFFAGFGLFIWMESQNRR